jgi:hypothetical protein
MMRLRTNLAWRLRGIAKWINARAEQLEPIKISRSAPQSTSRAFLTSKSMAERIIDRARG